LIKERGLDARGCVEKADLVALLSQHAPSAPTPPTREAATGEDDGFDAAALGVRELKRLLALHGVPLKGVAEKRELVDALQARLASCPICLCEPEGAVARCGSCRAAFCRGCAARHCVTAAENARLPVRCPSCPEAWPSATVAEALRDDVEGKRRYNVAARGVNELRAQRRITDKQHLEELKRAGVRQCPGCGALVEKVTADALSASLGTHGRDLRGNQRFNAVLFRGSRGEATQVATT